MTLKTTPYSKNESYLLVKNQAIALLEKEDNPIARASNFCALLHHHFGFFWTGFYFFDPIQKNLMLGPFQGPVACLRIDLRKGVCGKSYQSQLPIVVKDVHQFPGHIACSPLSNSEIVVPFFRKEFSGVLDIDSTRFNHFDQEDSSHLQGLIQLLFPE